MSEFDFFWWVYRCSRTLVGYVVASSQYQAQILAKEKFGDFVWIERGPRGLFSLEKEFKNG